MITVKKRHFFFIEVKEKKSPVTNLSRQMSLCWYNLVSRNVSMNVFMNSGSTFTKACI